MLTILGNIWACILWGGLISIVLIVFLYFLLRILFPGYSLSVSGTFVLCVLGLLLFIQSFMLTGALYAKSYINDIRVFALNLVERMDNPVQSLTQNEQSEFLQTQISTQYPALKPYLKQFDADFGKEGKDVALTISKNIKSFIHNYILRRILWMCGFMGIGFLILRHLRPKVPAYYADIDLDL